MSAALQKVTAALILVCVLAFILLLGLGVATYYAVYAPPELPEEEQDKSKSRKLVATGRRAVFSVPSGKSGPLYLLRKQDDLISNCITRTGKWEQAEIDQVLRYVSKASAVVDAGANLGVWSIAFSKACPRGVVFAFEPQLLTFHQLGANLYLNHCTNVQTFRCALGSPEDVSQSIDTPFYIQEDASNNGASRLGRNRPTVVESSQQIEMRTLDSFLEKEFKHCKIDVMKIDVEGHEENLIKGAVEIVRRDLPVLFVECWTGARLQAMQEPLKNLGYSWSRVFVGVIPTANYLGIPKPRVYPLE